MCDGFPALVREKIFSQKGISSLLKNKSMLE